jgi:hypothetical protein
MKIPKLFEPLTPEQELYKQFLLEHREYAELIGYNLDRDRGIREAMADRFLFKEFMAEELCSYF